MNLFSFSECLSPQRLPSYISLDFTRIPFLRLAPSFRKVALLAAAYCFLAYSSTSVAQCQHNHQQQNTSVTCSCTGVSVQTRGCSGNANYSQGCQDATVQTVCGTNSSGQQCSVWQGQSCNPSPKCDNSRPAVIPDPFFDQKIILPTIATAVSACSSKKPFDDWLQYHSSLVIQARAAVTAKDKAL